MLEVRRILVKCRQHLYLLEPASALYQVEFGGAAV
jgi:hypothetical protein